MITQLADCAIGRPITRAGISFFPVFLHQREIAFCVGGAGDVLISEHPDAVVPSLRVENPGSRPVLLVEGETVTGGNQNRVINISVLVPASGGVDVPVSCVEQGRWGGASTFGPSRTFATRRIRRAKEIGVSRNLRRSGTRHSDQGAVWTTVEHELDRLGVESATSRFDAADQALDRDRAATRAAAALVDGGPLAGQCGIVVSHGSRVVAAEVFAAGDMLAARWEPIVRSHLLDAPRGVPSTPSATNALRFLHRFSHAPTTVVPGVGLGAEHHVAHRRLAGQALVWNGVVVHASAFALAA